MAQFPSPGHLVSWAKICPQTIESGPRNRRFRAGAHLASWAGRTSLDNSSGKRKGKAKSKKGNRYLGGLLGETAVAAGKTQTREGARYRRLARRRWLWAR